MTDTTYPPAIDPDLVGEYPALSKAGGGYFFDDVLEYRVWVHDPEGGDDYFYAFATYEEAVLRSQATQGAEPPLVLIRQHEYVDEPEPGVLIHMKEERIAEWRTEWLDRGARKPGDIERFIAERSSPAE